MKRWMRQQAAVGMWILATAAWAGGADAPRPEGKELNLAPLAEASTSFVSGHETLDAIKDGFAPRNKGDHRHGAYGNWPQTGTQWVQYDWSRPISTARVAVYWWDDARGVRLPAACRLLYWDGKAFVPVQEATGLGVEGDTYNVTTFAEVSTPKLRLEIDGREKFSTGILEWQVFDTGKSPKFPPRVSAGNDRVVVLPAAAVLRGWASDGTVLWSKASGPGEVVFAAADARTTAATFSAVGEYVLRLTARENNLGSHSDVSITVKNAPPPGHLDSLEPVPYTLTSPFWNSRIKGQIVHWIPHCVAKLSDPNLPEGGLENFVRAGDKLAARAHGKHVGPPWANAYVHNTVESMCLALLVDAQGDAEILAAQAAMRKTLEEWIPKILAAQEPDGYLHTAYTLGGQNRWSHKPDHEGYNAGYFIEAALAHYRMTGGKDTRLYDAARRLADCWARNIGPAPKRAWYDGHEELEQALVRLAWFVDKQEGPGQGRKYLDLAKFLLDARRNGEEYDQSHLPVVEQTEAVGHAVRAVYLYSAMAGVAMETGEPGYHSAVESIWNNLVHRKYYVTGGVGSGETSEGFGKDYSLPHNAYCESCSGCGEVMFQHKMQMMHRDARYADLYEETLYNAVLGSVDLVGQHFTYTNALDSQAARYKWHGCPCCVGNIPRVLLMLPTWMYTRDADNLYVNLYIGSRVKLDGIELVQETDYPWSGKVSMVVTPAAPRTLAIRLRVPGRTVSRLYTASPACDGVPRLRVNGAAVAPSIENGYVVLNRSWQQGDRIELEFPMGIQRVRADARVAATAGRVALRYGPLIYNIESKDQNVEALLGPDSPLTLEPRPDLLGGVWAIRGTFADGKPLLAIPNYARLNRGGRSVVWIRER